MLSLTVFVKSRFKNYANFFRFSNLQCKSMTEFFNWQSVHSTNCRFLLFSDISQTNYCCSYKFHTIYTHYTSKRRKNCWDSGNVSIIKVAFTDFAQMATKRCKNTNEWILLRFQHLKIILIFTKWLHRDNLRYTHETKKY